MAVLKKLNPNANDTNVLAITDGIGLCSDDDVRKHYEVTEDVSSSDVASVNVTDGTTTSTVALDGAPIDWSDAANDEALILALEKVAKDLGYTIGDNMVELTRVSNDLTIRIPNSTLKFNWIGTASTDENSFAESAVG